MHVVYSQSLFTLGLIEEYLAKQNVPGSEEMWLKNKNYFRMLLSVYFFSSPFVCSKLK